MALVTFYEQINGDLDDVRKRLLTDERVEKFVRLFVTDETFSALGEAFEEGRADAAFRAAHTLKGISRDLGFTVLSERASELTEALRADENGTYGSLEAASDLHAQISEAYDAILSALPLLDA